MLSKYQVTLSHRKETTHKHANQIVITLSIHEPFLYYPETFLYDSL